VGQLSIPYLLYSTGILLREGLETILVIVALAAGARQANDPRRVRSVYAGGAVAIAASIVIAWLTNVWLSDNAGDALEGGFQIFAAATLFYVSSWLTSKSQSDRWREFIEHRAQGSEQSKLPGLALAITAFVAVIREGGETIVFYQGLLAGTTEHSETAAVVAGIGIASMLLVIIFVALRGTLERIPVVQFFVVTSALLYLMAIVFVGNGIASLQEASVVPTTFVNHLPTIKILGLFPTWEGVLAQGALAVFAALAFFSPRLKFSVPADRQPPRASVPGAAKG
jgi:high-affinity iron transporter